MSRSNTVDSESCLVSTSKSAQFVIHPQVLKIQKEIKTPSPVRVTRDKEQPSQGVIKIKTVKGLSQACAAPATNTREISLNLGLNNLLSRRKLLSKKN